MSEKNKCVGLDCEMCGNTKCPNEEKETIINGIDVSECMFYSNNNCDIGYIADSYPINCKNNPDCRFKQLKRLQEENEDLKSRNANLRLNLATYDLPEIKKVLTDWRTGELDKKFKKLQKENEKLKADLKGETEQCQKWYQLETDKHFQMVKCEQALEEIREQYIHSIFYKCDKTEEECPCHNCIILGQLDRVQNIVKIIDEALNDRD